jgi:hypothetical protein
VVVEQREMELGKLAVVAVVEKEIEESQLERM